MHPVVSGGSTALSRVVAWAKRFIDVLKRFTVIMALRVKSAPGRNDDSLLPQHATNQAQGFSSPRELPEAWRPARCDLLRRSWRKYS
jgi:hypothetical protein